MKGVGGRAVSKERREREWRQTGEEKATKEERQAEGQRKPGRSKR